MMALTTFNGRCHCGAVQFLFRSEPITEGVRCNCSICIRKGAVMSVPYFAPDVFELVVGREALTLYQWGDRLVNHWFCSKCGVYPFHEATERPGHYRVNLGCVEGVDPLSLRISVLDGRAF